MSETAHHKNGRCVEILRNLIMKRGDGDKHAVGESTEHWAYYEPRDTMRNDSGDCRSNGNVHEVPGLNASPDHDNDAIRRCQVNLWRNAHHEDVCIGPANASTPSRGRKGGGVHRENGHPWMFVHEQLSALDALASSPNLQTLQSNNFRCTATKSVSTRRAAFVAPPKIGQASHIPRSQ
jgi:hypothetical protein